MTEKKLPNGLVKTDPLAEIKDAIQAMTFKQKRLYQAYYDQTRRYTNEDLSETEYEQLAMIQLWLQEYDAWQKEDKVRPHQVDPKLEDQARKYRNMLFQSMQAYRKERRPKTLDLDECKELIIEMETDSGGKLDLKWSKGPETIVVDVPKDEKKKVDADSS